LTTTHMLSAKMNALAGYPLKNSRRTRLFGLCGG